MSHFMVEFALPEEFTDDFLRKIPHQRRKVNELMEQQKIQLYALSTDRQQLWCIVRAETEAEVVDIITEFPLINYLVPTITELMFTNAASLRMPLFSLN
jgi:hypothetical protein